MTGITKTSTLTKKNTTKVPSVAFEYGDLTLKDFLEVITELAEYDKDIMDFPLVWCEEDGTAHSVRFEPMTGRIRNGRFVLDEPAKVLCIN